MASKLQVRESKPLFENELITGDISTKMIDMQAAEGIAFQINWEGGTDITGELTVECSVDGEDFCTFSGSNSSMTGTSGGHLYDIVETHVRFLRIRANVSSGSSLFTVVYNLRTREI